MLLSNWANLTVSSHVSCMWKVLNVASNILFIPLTKIVLFTTGRFDYYTAMVEWWIVYNSIQRQILCGRLTSLYLIFEFSFCIFFYYYWGRRPFSYITHNNSVCEYGSHPFEPACSSFTRCYNWPPSPPTILRYFIYCLCCSIVHVLSNRV